MNGPAGMGMAMGMNPATGGPVGAPHMNQVSQAGQNPVNQSQLNEMQLRLNTYIYDHLIVSKQYECARVFKRFHSVKTTKHVQGTTPVEQPKEDVKRDDLEDAETHPHLGEHSFLLDWFCMFWDTYNAARQRATYRPLAVDYMTQQRLRSNNDQLKFRMGMAMSQNAMGMNGMNGMKPGQGRPPQQVQAEMQRRMHMGQAGLDGQRPQTPTSMEGAPSPSKKPRLDNGDFNPGMPGQRPMGHAMMPNGMDAQMGAFAGQNGQPKMEGMNGMSQLGPRMPEDLEFVARAGAMAATGPGNDGRHALQDYQLQLMLLEQQNKKRLLQARREQDTISTNMQGPPGAGPPAGMMNNGTFAPNMSPQGSRGGGPSPGPSDQMKRGTPKLTQTGLPGSPMGDMQRNSPGAPGFDPNNGQMPAGMPANYYQQQQAMRQPQTSHPNFQQMAMPGMNAQQIDQMQRMNNINNGRMMNGQNVPGQAAPFNAQAAAAGTPQQRPGTMAPPPAPAEAPGAQSGQRAESSPAQPAAPPTPSQASKPAPKKKETAAQKKKNAPKKGANATTAATPTESADAPVSTPATPMTPSVRDTFPKTGAPSTTTTQALAPPPPAAPPVIDNGAGMFGMEPEFDVTLDFAAVSSGDVLDNFDFDSFLTTDEGGISGFDSINFDGNEIGTGNV